MYAPERIFCTFICSFRMNLNYLIQGEFSTRILDFIKLLINKRFFMYIFHCIKILFSLTSTI